MPRRRQQPNEVGTIYWATLREVLPPAFGDWAQRRWLIHTEEVISSLHGKQLEKWSLEATAPVTCWRSLDTYSLHAYSHLFWLQTFEHPQRNFSQLSMVLFLLVTSSSLRSQFSQLCSIL